MTDQTAISAADRGLPAASARLAQFAAWTGTTPPATILEGDGDELTFNDAFLDYCADTGLSIDWVWCGEEQHFMSLVRQMDPVKKQIMLAVIRGFDRIGAGNHDSKDALGNAGLAIMQRHSRGEDVFVSELAALAEGQVAKGA